MHEYKRGVMQALFSGKLRFKDENGNPYPDWETKSLEDILTLRSERNTQNAVSEVFSVAKNAGVINQIEHLGRSFASSDLSSYKIVHPGDIVYTKSPTSDFPYGIIKQNKLGRSGVVSVLYGVYEPTNTNVGYLLDAYFNSWQNTYNYLNPIVQKGAKNTINIGDGAFLKGRKMPFPTSEEEQQKIADFMGGVDDIVTATSDKVAAMHEYKRGVMQALFSGKLRFKDENGNPYPDWETKNLSELYEVFPANSLSREMLGADGDISNIHYGDIHTKLPTLLDLSTAALPKVKNPDVLKQTMFVKNGDVIVADASEDYSDIGKSIEVVNIGKEKVVAGLHTIHLRPKDSIAIGFGGYLFMSHDLRRAIMRIATGVSVLGISKGNLMQLPIELPTKQEQQKIADFLSALDAKIQLEEAKLKQTKEYKKGLLQRMFV